jgi:hypothetical protein
MKSKHLLHLLMMALLVPGIVNAQNLPANGPKTTSEQNLTVNAGTQKSWYIPFAGIAAAHYTSSQFIIPASSLNAMVGSEVNKLTFYGDVSAVNWGNATIAVYMRQVENEAFSSDELVDWSILSQVYQGTLSVTNYRMEITLQQSFTYTGDNLMIGFDLTNAGSYGEMRWYGVRTSYRSAVINIPETAQEVSNAENNNMFLPEMTFTYSVTGYPSVYPIDVNVIGSSATFTWTAPSPDVTGYAYQIKPASSTTWSEWISTDATMVECDTFSVSNAEYDFRIKALYGSEESYPTRVRFTTGCPEFVEIPFHENFDNVSGVDELQDVTALPNTNRLPDCWDYISNSQNILPSVYQYYIRGQIPHYPYANTEKNCLLFNVQSGDTQAQYAMLPMMQHIGILKLTLNARRFAANTSGVFEVGVMKDNDPTTFELITTIDPQSETYVGYEIDFTGYLGNGNRIAIRMSNPGKVCIDDINVSYTVPVPSTFIKHIESYENPQDPTWEGWYLISSPLAGDIEPADVENLLASNPVDFDLYRFEQYTIYFDAQEHGLEWENWKAIEPHYSIEPLRGYLYANRATVDLTFTGVPYYGDGKVTLKKVETLQDGGAVEFPGWNLIGNPWNSYASIGGRAYYRINAAGNEVISGTDNIPAMEAVFVIAQADGEEVTFTPTDNPTPRQAMNLALNLSYNSGKVIDRTILTFGEGSTLPKFQLNPNHTKVYIPQNGKDYAVVNAEGQGEMPINFRAAENGNYTLSFSKDNVEFSYLHLIDNMTSDDIDLLSTPSYTFKAKTSDYESRFKLVYASNSKTEGDESFGFINESGNFSVYGIEGEATLQMIDMTGRVISTDTFNGSIEKKIDITNGIYMFRLINGDNVKVQKVVVK